MYSITRLLIFVLLVTSFASAQITDEHFANFNELKQQLKNIDIKKSGNDASYIKIFDKLQASFEALNAAYWETADKDKSKITPMISASTNKAAVELQFYKTPVTLINAKFDELSCYESWKELKSSATLDKELFDHFKEFIKARCSTKYKLNFSE